MSAEILRRAASLMRERAEARGVPASPWFVEDDGRDFNVLAVDPESPSMPWDVARDVPSVGPSDDTSPIGEHIASWHPAVALAVAALLDQTARDWQAIDDGVMWSRAITWEATKFRSLAVARAYLGESL